MPLQIQGNNGVVQEVDGTTFRAARVTPRPVDYGAFGAYSIAVKTGSIAATLAALSPIFSARWGDATRFALIERIALSARTVGAITAGVDVDFDLMIARAFTASDTGGTAVTPFAGNNQKRRTGTMGTSLFTDMRIATTAALGAGTRTLDTNPVRISPICWTPLTALQPWFTGWASAAGAAGTSAQQDVILWDAYQNDGFHPIVLAQNEGILIRNNSAGPATGTFEVKLSIDWMEVPAY